MSNEIIRQFIDEHWKARAVAAMDRYRKHDPRGWEEYLAEADAFARADSPVAD